MTTTNGHANGTARLRRSIGRNPTRTYAPTGPWWGYPSSVLDGVPYFTWFDVPRMLRDPRVRFVERMWRAPFQRVKWRVRCENPKAAKWVDASLRRFWRGSLPRILSRYFRYGFAPAGAEFVPVGGRWRLDRVRAVEPPDAQPLVWAGGPDKGRPAGFRVRTAAAGDSYVGPPHAAWFAGHAELSPFFDTPPLAGMFDPWLEKRTRGGAIAIRKGWFRRCAFKGGSVHHPPGTTFVGTDESPAGERDNADIAREALEYAESGSVFTWTNEPNPADPSKYNWDYQPAEAHADVAGVRDYPKDLDAEMLEGAGIPPEVLEAADVGSGWSGRLIPLMAFLGGVDELAGVVVESADPWLKAGVEVNFGRTWFEVELLSLAEEVQAQAKAGKGGAEGANPVPGLLGRQGVEMSAAHAPAGGVSVGGRDYSGGEFIPSEVMDRATPEERAAVAGRDPVDSRAGRLVRALKGLPKRAVKKAREKVKATYAKLEQRYGPGYARVIVGAGLSGLPIPLPGASVMMAAPVLAVAELHRQLSKLGAPVPANPDIEGIVKPATRWFLARVFSKVRGALHLSDGRSDDDDPPEPLSGRGTPPEPHGDAHARTHDEREFHDKINESPDEPQAGFAYADWLRDQGLDAHADVVQQHATRRKKAAVVSGERALDEMTDPDVPWETAIAAQEMGNADRHGHRVWLWRKAAAAPGRVLHWASDLLPQADAAKLVRRLTAEARPRIPEGGEVVFDANAQQLWHHGLPEFEKKTIEQNIRQTPYGEPLKPDTYDVNRWRPQLSPSGQWNWVRGRGGWGEYPSIEDAKSYHPEAETLELGDDRRYGWHAFTPAEIAHWKRLLAEAGEPAEFHTDYTPKSREMSDPRDGDNPLVTDGYDPSPDLFPEERDQLIAAKPATRDAYQHMVKKGLRNKPGTLPTVAELKALAEVGEPVRGSYDDAHKTVSRLLGDPADANRWVTANAILSAQTGWEAHTAGATEALAAWHQAGRPTDKAGLDRVFGTTGRNEKGASVIFKRGLFRGPDTLTGSKVDAIKRLFASADDPGVEWGNISQGSLKTPNFGKAFVDPRGVPIDTHMAKLTVPAVDYTHADVRRIAERGNAGGRTASDMLEAQKALIGKPATALAYKTLVARAAAEMGWEPRQVQESVWTAALAVMTAKHLGASNKAADILGRLTRQAVQAGWSLNTVLKRPEVVGDFAKLGVSKRKLQKAIEASKKRLPAGGGSPRTSDSAALEAGALRLPAGVPAAAVPIARSLSDGGHGVTAKTLTDKAREYFAARERLARYLAHPMYGGQNADVAIRSLREGNEKQFDLMARHDPEEKKREMREIAEEMERTEAAYLDHVRAIHAKKEPWELTKEEAGHPVSYSRMQEGLDVGDERVFFRVGGLPPGNRSMNTMTGQREAGVSVYTTPAVGSFAGHVNRPWFYGRGKVVGWGGDDEPLVEPVGKWEEYPGHEQVVAAAVKAGHPVPPEVLADYPHLGKKEDDAPPG